MERIFKYIDDRREEIIDTLSRWISVPSVADESSADGTPYGKKCAEMLDMALEDARRLGVAGGKNFDYHMLTIDLGEGKPEIAVACHLDVVDANAGEWKTDPWCATVKGDRIYGRGASDNKSAGVAALYALAALKQAGVKGNARIYMGSAEEIGSPGFMYYQENYEKREDLPFMIVPDAGNEIIYGEWGIMRASISGEISQKDEKKLLGISCGEAYNIIPATAIASVCGIADGELEELRPSHEFEAERNGDTVILTVRGKSCHSSMPAEGDNAALKMLKLLSALPFEGGVKTVLLGLLRMYTESPEYVSELVEKDALTFSLTGLFFEGGVIRTWHDSRLSNLASSDELKKVMTAEAEKMNCKIEFPLTGEPHFVDPDSDRIKKLVSVYEEFTGEKAVVREMRAATYASETCDGVAFGQFEGENLHSNDENIKIEDVIKTAKLLALTMYRFLQG